MWNPFSLFLCFSRETESFRGGKKGGRLTYCRFLWFFFFSPYRAAVGKDKQAYVSWLLLFWLWFNLFLSALFWAKEITSIFGRKCFIQGLCCKERLYQLHLNFHCLFFGNSSSWSWWKHPSGGLGLWSPSSVLSAVPVGCAVFCSSAGWGNCLRYFLKLREEFLGALSQFLDFWGFSWSWLFCLGFSCGVCEVFLQGVRVRNLCEVKLWGQSPFQNTTVNNPLTPQNLPALQSC